MWGVVSHGLYEMRMINMCMFNLSTHGNLTANKKHVTNLGQRVLKAKRMYISI